MPASSLVLVFAFGLLLLSMFCSNVLINPESGDNLLLSFVVALLGYVGYGFILVTSGFAKRFSQTISAIMATGSILTIMMVFVFVMFAPFVGNNIAGTFATLILFWSVPVKGHIIARAINRHWYVGIAIAMTIFVLQYATYRAMTGQT